MSVTSKAEILVSRLDGVRVMGHDKWMAKCPAHEDRSPSLSVSVADKVLIHCFAGCHAGDVLEAVGLTFADLFDDPGYQAALGLGRRRKPKPAFDLEHERGILEQYKAELANGQTNE